MYFDIKNVIYYKQMDSKNITMMFIYDEIVLVIMNNTKSKSLSTSALGLGWQKQRSNYYK